MPPRLNHRKSTTGCRRCKTRKVKCDEKRPQCRHCARHKLPCEYPELETRAFDPTRSKPPKAAGRWQPRSDASLDQPSPSPVELPVLNMSLLHHWTTETAMTMSSAQIPSVQEMWTKTVPQMAFEHQPLLHTILALGAAHRASLNPSEASTLRPVYHRYIDFSIQHHRPVTARLDNGINEHVCLNAILLSLYTIYLRSETPDDPYEPPLLWLSVSRGIRTVIKTIYKELIAANSRLIPLFLSHPPAFEISNAPPWMKAGVAGEQPRRPFDFILEHQRETEEMNSEIENAYLESVRYIELMYAVTETESPFNIRKILTGFPSRVPRAFFDLISEKRPRALVILGYLFALAIRADDIWWLKGIPAREVRGIESILPTEWKWTMVWPLNLVSEAAEHPSRESAGDGNT